VIFLDLLGMTCFDRPSRGSDWVIGAGFDPAARQAETLATDADLGDSKRGNPVLILDSVASCHAAADRWCLSDFDAASPGDGAAVHRTRDGRELPIAGSGSVARGNFQVPGVRYVPGLLAGTILISVPQLAAWGYIVMFGGGKCVVMDRSGGKPVGQGFLQEDDGFYRLQFLKISLDLEHN
jgi:hypothetical protein